MENQKHPNPDNRANNVERLHDMIENTERKIQETEISLEFTTPDERAWIEAKNERRKLSVDAMKEEMEEEMAARKRGEV